MNGTKVICTMSFDKATKLLVKVSGPSYNPKTRRLGTSDTYYSDYHSFSGLVVPRKSIGYLDGQKFVEKTIEDFTVLERVDSSQFTVESE